MLGRGPQESSTEGPLALEPGSRSSLMCWSCLRCLMPVTSEPEDHHHLSQAVPLEDVEQLMQDNADAKAYEDSLRQMLGEGVGWAAHQLQLKRLCGSRGMHGTVPAWLLAQFLHFPRPPPLCHARCGPCLAV